jgi:kumamolisin
MRHLAIRHGLLLRLDWERDCAHLEGSAAQISELFETHLGVYCAGQAQFRAYSGVLSVPDTIAPWTLAVLGLDQRPVAKRQLTSLAGGSSGPGLWPTEVAEIYGIPPELDGRGECIGVIAAGGNYRPEDIRTANARMNRRQDVLVIPFPVVGLHQTYPVNGFTGRSEEDIELALDLEILAGIVPAAKIVVYFTANSEQGFMDAINQVLADGVNNPSVLSISWGGAELIDFSHAACTKIDELLATTQDLLTVVAAAGDGLATADVGDNHAHVLFPASSSYVIACGGTQLHSGADGWTRQNETVWNKDLMGSDGGISDIFDVPDYQQNILLPESCNRGREGRGVPDVSAAASQVPGYRIILDDKEIVSYGTSAAAPFWAALIAMANARRGRPNGRPLGLIHNFLYQKPQCFREIVEGDNRRDGIGYYAGKGWNACTGLGVPNGADTVNSLSLIP